MGSWFEPTTTHVEPAWMPKDTNRSTIELIETCVITLILCAWTAIHLDIPSEEGRKSLLRCIFTRMQWTVIGILVPEYILWIAFAEFWEARSICRGLRKVQAQAQNDAESNPNGEVPRKDENKGDLQNPAPGAEVTFTLTKPDAELNLHNKASDKQKYLHEKSSSTEVETVYGADSLGVEDGRLTRSSTKTRDFAIPDEKASRVIVESIREESQDNSSPGDSSEIPWWNVGQKIKTWNSDIELVLGFYVEMGGYEIIPVDDDGKRIDRELVPQDLQIYLGRLTSRGAITLHKKGLLPIPAHGRINDQSKMDILAKAITCIQASWMIVQCIGRKVRGLPLTLLEVNTVMHVMCALFVFLLWLRKPQDIRYPTEIPAKTTDLKHFQSIIEGAQNPTMIAETRGKALEEKNKDSIWKLLNKLLQNRKYCVPETIKLTEPPTDSGVELGSCRTSRFHEAVGIGAVIGLITSSIYGAVHLTQWYDHFPTRLERAMWRISGCIVVGMPFFLALFLILIYAIRYIVSERKVGSGKWKLKNGTWIYKHSGFDPKGNSYWQAQYQPHYQFLKDMKKNNRWDICLIYIILMLFQLIASLSYVSARTFLVVEAFASLRSLPKGSYTTINWQAFIPHF